jgi:hypothetical protein
MTDFSILFDNYFVSFTALFATYIKSLMVAGFLAYIIKGLGEFLT